MAAGLVRYLRSLAELPADATLAWRRDGYRGAGTLVVNRTLRRLYMRRRSLVLAHDLHALKHAPVPSGVDIRSWVGDYPSALSAIATRNQLRHFDDRAAAGHTCIVAMRGAAAVGYGWTIDNPEQRIEKFPLPMPAGAAYCTDLYVVPSERGRGTGTAIVLERLLHLRRRGFNLAWRVVGAWNVPSLMAWRKVSPRAWWVGEVSRVRVLGIERAWFYPRAGEPFELPEPGRSPAKRVT